MRARVIATYLNLVLEQELVPLGLVEFPRHLLPGVRLAPQLLVERTHLGVELALLLLQEGVARSLLLEQQPKARGGLLTLSPLPARLDLNRLVALRK